MNKKENTLKKAGIGLLTTAIISSQMIANVPFNVLAAQTATTTKSAPNATTQSQKLGATEIQLENTEFNGPSGWHPIFATEPAEVSDAQGSYWLSGPSVLNGTFEGQPNPYGSHIHDMGPAHAVTWFSGNGVVHIGADYLALASPNPAYGIAQAFTTIPGHKYSFTYTASYDGISDMYWATNYVVAFSNYSGSVDDMRTSTTSSPIFMTTPKMAEGTPQTVTFTATSTQTYLQLEERGIYDNGDAVTFSNISGITDLDADSTAPVINAGDKTLAVGDSFDPKTDVTASDDTDGDITSKIQVTANNVDTSKAGTYNVTYSVADAAGNTITKTITVTVQAAADTTAPTITASDKTLMVGDSFDPKADVTANDDTDGDLTSKVTVTANNVDTSKAGTYNVTYSVTDTAGNVGTKTIQVIVNSNLQITINPLTDKDTVITGTGTPGRRVSFYDWTTFSFIPDEYTGAVIDASGNYNFPLSDYLVAGHDIAAILKDDQNIQARTTVTHVEDTTKPVIAASDKTLTVGDSFDPKADVTANDDTDGDLTSKVTVTANNVDTSKAGTYNVSYSVTDAAGNTATKTITVIVQAAADTTKPVITASDRTIAVGDSFYAKEGVTASDDRDGDLTSKVEVT
ncbi:immunoglobulin-like domain-containing protein, partial [Listeria portnoyi]|uniref:immunoglobulin-like domain-containing protein n=1 Tax=Listeria portnoyi TaxID=2713504 RepID=UPI001C9C12EC